MNKLIYILMNKETVIDFIINKFNEINVSTKKEDWIHIKDFQSSSSYIERKFNHPVLGYFDIHEENNKEDNKLHFMIPTLKLLREISKTNNLDLVKKLFTALEKENGNPNITYYEDDEYNLTNACKFGQLEIIKFLVEKGVNIHVDSEINVISALKNKHYQVANYLLNNDKNINQEIVLKESNDEMINFLENYNLYKNLNKEIELRNTIKNKIKI